MTYNPPYTLSGESGKCIGTTPVSLADIGIHAATLVLRSLNVDELAFTQREKPGRLIPQDGEWLTLRDASGSPIFHGLAKRKFIYPQRLWQVTVTSVYQGLLDTPLTDASGKAFVSYPMSDLSTTLAALLARANALGLPIQAPSAIPAGMVVPKMAFRAASIGSALEDALKWAPHMVSFADYSTTPPTLQFTVRVPASARILDLDTPGHGVTALDLTAMPEARALFISFVYAIRQGELIVNYLTQSAGDPEADAHRSVSIYLSGHERSDMLVSEAVVASQNALAASMASLTAANAAVAAVNAQISATYAAAMASIPGIPAGGFNVTAYAAANDSALATGTAAGVTWQTSNVGLWSATSINGSNPGGSYVYSNVSGLFYANASAPATHVSAPAGVCAPGTYTTAQLSTAGASATSGLIVGQMMFLRPASGNHGYSTVISGWTRHYNTSQAAADADYRSYQYANLAGTPVWFLNMSLTAINNALALAAAAAATNVTPVSSATTFIAAAEFNEAPADLALNYFNAQDWTPYKGQLTLTPNASVVPRPGEFVSISGADLPAEFATMASPVSELSLDLSTGSTTVTLGPSARMTYASLQDRLRISPEDNYQTG